MANDTHAESVKKLAELIKGIRMAMLTTADTDGTLRSRPMATQESDVIDELWFFTRKDSHKAVELEADHRVNLSYADPSKSRYVSISGTGRVIVDPAKQKQLWNPILKAWFPKGLDDPELALLKVTPSQAEYWDAPGGAIAQMLYFAKAIVTGKPANPGSHEKVSL